MQTHEAIGLIHDGIAGVTLKSGNYSVTPNSGQGHIVLQCYADTRTSAFTISLGTSTLQYTVCP